MKKIINGKMYSTDTATRVGMWENGYRPSDFTYCSENLYRKKTGEFFIYGEGGAQSKYAESHGDNSWGGGEQIIPLSYPAAQKWAEENLSADDYEKVFGEVSEDDSKVTATFSIPADVLKTAKRNAAKEGLSISAYVEKMLTK